MIKSTIFMRDQRGASAAEFALTLPLLVLLLLGLIDVGRFMYEMNSAEKATQMGVRYAVSTEMVPAGLETYSFATSGGILAGEPVPTSSFEQATCDTSTCSCTPGGAACTAAGYDAAAFDAIVARMKIFYPYITDTNVTVEYRNVGLGFSGDPGGSDVAALVTVRLQGIQYRPLTGLLFGVAIPMGAFSAALTLEDGAGTVAN
jgi:Flp pilus assembly protein TadG